jgi:hypothetical protein
VTCPSPTSCSCDCHNGYERPCTIPGGCGLTTTPATRLHIDVTDLDVDISELTARNGYLERILDLIPEPGSDVVDIRRHTKVTGSPAPWNDEAAGLLFDIHAGARRHDHALRVVLGFHPVQRSGSHQATIDALRALLPLMQLALGIDGLTDTAPLERAARDIRRWPRDARRLLDDDPKADERPHTKAPGDLRCPYCDRRLILKHGWQHESAQDIWCLRCPSTKSDEFPHGQDLSWPATAWLLVLQQQDDTRSADGA